MFRRAFGRHAIGLKQIEPARLPTRIKMECMIGAALNAPGGGDKGIPVEIAVALAPVLEELTGRHDSDVVGSFLDLAATARARGEGDRRRAPAGPPPGR